MADERRVHAKFAQAFGATVTVGCPCIDCASSRLWRSWTEPKAAAALPLQEDAHG